MHLDMNSFFATVEQQANPFLRGQPIGVSGRPGTRSIVAAASIEAKRAGVKTAMGTAEALAANPNMRLVVGDNRRYQAVSRQMIKILLRHSPDVEVFSVDECFVDLTSAVRWSGRAGWQTAADIACTIKGQIRREIGDYLSCSIGIAENKFLAKLASDQFKPDGLHLVADVLNFSVQVPSQGLERTRLLVSQKDELLLGLPPREFCGLGPRLEKHLARLGIVTTKELRQADPALLKRVFGVVGQQLQNYAWGRDERPVQIITTVPPPKSFSHAITLPVGDFLPTIARGYLCEMAEKVGRRLRRAGMAGRRVDFFVRFGMYDGWHGGVTLRRPTTDSQQIYQVAVEQFDRLSCFRPVRQVGVRVSMVQPIAELPLPLLIEDQKRERVIGALDLINDDFGEGVAFLARSLTSKKRQYEATHAFGFKPSLTAVNASTNR